MDNSRFALLFQRYIDQICTEDERTALMLMISAAEYDDELKSRMDRLWQTLTVSQKLSRQLQDKILKEIFKAAFVMVVAVRYLIAMYCHQILLNSSSGTEADYNNACWLLVTLQTLHQEA